MTISSQNRQAGPYLGNDVAKAFTFAFKVFAASDLQVVRTDAAGVESTLTLTADYTVTLNSNQDSNPGGTVTLVAGALASGAKLTLTSNIIPLQATDLTNQGGFYPKVITNALDKLTILIQQILNGLNRSIKLPISNSDDVTLPAGDRANTVIGFDALGKLKLLAAQTGTSLVNLAASSGSSLVGYLPAGTGAATRSVQDKLREVVSVEDFGAYPSKSASVNTEAINKALQSGAKKVRAGAGTFAVNGQITIPPGVSLIGEGRNATFFTADGNTTVGAFPDGGVVCLVGDEPTTLPTLAVSPVMAANELSFSGDHGLTVGDLIMIYNPTDYSYSSARAYYRAGEYCVVSAVLSATSIRLEAPLYAEYNAAAVNIYKCGGYASGGLNGFTAIAPGVGENRVVGAVRLTYCRGVEMHDVGARNSNNASMSILRSYGVTGRSLDCHQISDDTGLGTQYGLVIGNSQKIDITGNFVGNRHAIAQGGGATFAVPTRGTNVHDFFAHAYGGTGGGLHTIDWHGNSEHCVYENGTVTGGGALLAGNHNRLSNIDMMLPIGMVVNSSELSGLDHVVEGIRAYTGRNDISRGLIDIGGAGPAFDGNRTTHGGTITIRDVKINAPNVQQQAVVIRNRGFSAEPWSVVVDGLEMVAPNSTFSTVLVSTVSGNPPSRVRVTDTVTISNTNSNAALSLGALDGDVLVTQSSVTGSTSVATTTGTSVATTAVTFGRSFAKRPVVLVNPSTDTTGTDRCSAIATPVLNTGFTAQYRRMDVIGSNFSAAINVRVDWTASLNEW